MRRALLCLSSVVIALLATVAGPRAAGNAIDGTTMVDFSGSA